jgi:hypothetical protein
MILDWLTLAGALTAVAVAGLLAYLCRKLGCGR